jgi:hypothetical protein
VRILGNASEAMSNNEAFGKLSMMLNGGEEVALYRDTLPDRPRAGQESLRTPSRP